LTPHYAFEREWCNSAFPLSTYDALSRAWAFSRQRLSAIRGLLDAAQLPDGIMCIGIAGSLARMEATAESDCDLVVILQDGIEGNSPAAELAFLRVWEALGPLKLERPVTGGIYAGPVASQKLFDPTTLGRISEDPRAFGFRITFLLELQPVYRDTAFRQVAARIVDRYASHYVELDESKQWTYLLNDLVRYYKSLCQTYLFGELHDDRLWRSRNLKARHSRLLIYVGLLFLLGEASRITSDKRGWLLSRLTWTPLERLANMYAIYQDPRFSVIARGMNQFVKAMGTPGFRERLAETQPTIDYLRRESNPDYQRLKKSADALLRELLRFALARQEDWEERFFEYWLF
jgi:hypothetical protein